MDFTREPIVETVITPREGFRLTIRSSKNPGQEEFVVDALEVVSFGVSCFYRHLERPRSFIVPASDYEVLEVRETRMPLKAASLEGTVKPTNTKETVRFQPKEPKIAPPKEVSPPEPLDSSSEKASDEQQEEVSSATPEGRIDRRKDRKKGNRRRRGGREDLDEQRPQERQTTPQKIEAPTDLVSAPVKETASTPPVFLAPPTTLIRDDLDRLRKNDQYRGAFYLREGEPTDKADEKVEEEVPVIPSLLQEEEPAAKIEEESVYKATPLPPEEDEVRSPLWIGGSALGSDKS